MTNETVDVAAMIKFVKSGAAKAYLEGNAIRSINDKGEISVWYNLDSDLTLDFINKGDKWEFHELVEVPYSFDVAAALIDESIISPSGTVFRIKLIGILVVMAEYTSVNGTTKNIQISYEDLYNRYTFYETGKRVRIKQMKTVINP